MLGEPEKEDAIKQGNFLADREGNGPIVQLYNPGKLYARCMMTRLAKKVLRYRASDDISAIRTLSDANRF